MIRCNFLSRLFIFAYRFLYYFRFRSIVTLTDQDRFFRAPIFIFLKHFLISSWAPRIRNFIKDQENLQKAQSQATSRRHPFLSIR